MRVSAKKTSNPPSVTIVTKVAEEEGIDPLELKPLHSTLETESLENLIEGSSSQYLRVEFEYCGYTVTVYGDGQVAVNRR